MGADEGTDFGLGSLYAGGFRRLRTAGYFARGGKVTKTPPGTAPDEHFVLIVAFPRTPVYGGRQLGNIVRQRKGAGGSAEWSPFYCRCR